MDRLPQLKGKLDGVSIRVPTPDVSFVDLSFVSKKETTVEEVNNAIIEYAKNNDNVHVGTIKEMIDKFSEEIPKLI